MKGSEVQQLRERQVQVERLLRRSQARTMRRAVVAGMRAQARLASSPPMMALALQAMRTTVALAREAERVRSALVEVDVLARPLHVWEVETARAQVHDAITGGPAGRERARAILAALERFEAAVRARVGGAA